tara:strand:- start:39238 stop:42375 length:3138 start_codon:yes stop_codon:yes gene_type:complete
MAREFFTDIDLNQNEMQFMVMHPLAAAPSSGTEVEGQMYYDTIAQQPFFWNGASWTSMSSGAASSVPFGGITGGTNTSATMFVGTGASLSFTGLGTINANLLDGRVVDAPAAQDGEFLIFTGGSVNAWQSRKIVASDFPELELNDLVDVDINAANDGDLLQYIGGSINAWATVPASAITADLGDAVILNPASSTRNVISNTDGSAHTLLTIEAGSASTYDLFVVNNSSSSDIFTISSDGDVVVRGTIQGGGSAGAADSTAFILDNSGIGGGPRTFTFPNASGEIITDNSTQDITGRKTFDSGDLRLEGVVATHGWAFSANKSSGGFDTLHIPQPTSDVDVTMLITEDTLTAAGNFAVAVNTTEGLVTFRDIQNSDIANILALGDLTDVDYSGGGPSDGDLLVYLGGSVDAWVHRSPESILTDLSYLKGGGSANQVAYWDGADSLTGESEFTYNGTDLTLSATGSSLHLTSSTSGVTIGSSSVAHASDEAILIISDGGSDDVTFRTANNSADAASALEFQKARDTIASPDAVINNDIQGEIRWFAHNGSAYVETATIVAQSTENASVSGVGTRLVFSTINDASPGSPTTKLILDDDGVKAQDNFYVIAASSEVTTQTLFRNNGTGEITVGDYSLANLSDVEITGPGPTEGDILVYLAGSVDAWVPRDPNSFLDELPYVNGSGNVNQVAYWEDSDTLTGEAAFAYDPSSNALSVTSGTVTSGAFITGAGSVSSPSLRFSGDANTGIYQVGADSVGISAGGVNGITVAESLSTINVTVRDNLRLSNGTNYVGFGLPSLAGDTNYTLPATASSSDGQVLSSTTAGILGWVSIGSIHGSDTDFASQYVFNQPATATRNNVTSQGATVVPLRLIGASGQTANLFEIEDNSNTNLFVVDASGNVTITGDLTINGTTTTVDTTNLIVEDNFIVVNSAGIVQDAGIEVERGGAGSGDNAFLRFSESTNEWYVDNGTVSHLMARKYVEEITGDDSTTTFNILHDMGSLYVLVQVFDSSTGKQVEIDVDVFSSDRVDLNFKAAPAGGQSYRVIVVG